MDGVIALVGGEEFRAGCEEMDREILRASGQDPAKVVVIPTAAVTGPAKAANDGVRHFSSLGGNAGQLMVLEREHTEDANLIKGIEGAGVIYFTGGSPDHLLAAIRDSHLWSAILAAMEQGTVLAGSSAGAMVMGSLMRRPRLGQWVQALAIAPGIAVLPHHEHSNPEEISRDFQNIVKGSSSNIGPDVGISITDFVPTPEPPHSSMPQD